MVVGTSEDRGESSVIEEVTKGVERSVKGRLEEDGGVCITIDGRVRQSLEVSKVGGRVDNVVEIPGEGDKEEGGIEGKPGGRCRGSERSSRRRKVGNIFMEGDISGSNITSHIREVDMIALLRA